MSARNTGLFVLGHVSASVVAEALAAWPEYALEHFAGEEAPRVGRTTWHDQPVTHVALRVFEVMGFRLLTEDRIPDATDLEMVLSAQLSSQFPVVVATYEDEVMAGGGARFENGALVYRMCVDGQQAIPTCRTLEGTHPIEDLDPSDWIWPHASAALTGAFPVGFHNPPQDDDALEQLILGAGAKAIPLAPHPSVSKEGSAPSGLRKRDRVKRALRGWFSR